MEMRRKETIVANDAWLDAEELPFTYDEVLQAASLWLDSEEAVEFTHAIANDAREYFTHRATWEVPFKPEPGRVGIANTQVDWLWPTLSVLSLSCAVRSTTWMEVYWSNRLSMEILRLKRLASVESESQPAEAASRDIASGRDAYVQHRLAHNLTLSPSEINAILHQAETMVLAEQAAWNKVASEAERRMQRRE